MKSERTEPIWINTIGTAKKFGKKIIISLGGIDTVPRRKLGKIMDFIKECANAVFLNEKECEFVQKYYQKEISLIFSEMELMVLTKGENGSLIMNKGEEISIQLSQKNKCLGLNEQIFEIGAGDAFCAGFLYALLRGANPKEAGEFASEVSLIKIKCPESHLTKASLADIEERRGKYAFNE